MNLNAEIYSLSWPNADTRLFAWQRKVFDRFQLPIHQQLTKIPHGEWMDSIMAQSAADVVMFLDNDCIPLSRSAVLAAIAYAATHSSFVGLAQASNHLGSGSHIYAAPPLLAISSEVWQKLGRPSFKETPRSDVAEELSWRAEEQKIGYRAIYPTHYTKNPSTGPWKLGNYGHYGIGTVFGSTAFHLYQGRLASNVELFIQACQHVCNDTFSTAGMISSVTM